MGQVRRQTIATDYNGVFSSLARSQYLADFTVTSSRLTPQRMSAISPANEYVSVLSSLTGPLYSNHAIS